MNKYDIKQLREKFLLDSDWHIHTNYVHGMHSLSECIKKAESNNLKLIAIVEHVRQNLTYDFLELLKEINRMRKESNVIILLGAEAKIKDEEGNLDISPMVEKKVDIVYGAFHSWFKNSKPKKEEYIEALLNMIKKGVIDIWAHPLLLPRRYNIYFEDEKIIEIIDTLKRYGTYLEINLNYKLPPTNFLNLALEASIPFVIGSDAHNKNQIWNKNKPNFIKLKIWKRIIEKVS
jgi:histidinol phosphatase-like PHP family hydrolase